MSASGQATQTCWCTVTKMTGLLLYDLSNSKKKNLPKILKKGKWAKN